MYSWVLGLSDWTNSQTETYRDKALYRFSFMNWQYWELFWYYSVNIVCIKLVLQCYWLFNIYKYAALKCTVFKIVLFVETPRKFITAKLSIRKPGSSSVLITVTDQKLCSNKFTWCFPWTKLLYVLSPCKRTKNLYSIYLSLCLQSLSHACLIPLFVAKFEL